MKPTNELPEAYRADEISLSDWAQRYGPGLVTHHKNGCVYVPAVAFGQGYRELFGLSDYLVSSVSGGSVCLIRREVTQ